MRLMIRRIIGVLGYTVKTAQFHAIPLIERSHVGADIRVRLGAVVLILDITVLVRDDAAVLQGQHMPL